jgi:hypothetical protein
VQYGVLYTNGDICSCIDLDNNKIYFAKNGTWQHSGDPTSGATGTGHHVLLTIRNDYLLLWSDVFW